MALQKYPWGTVVHMEANFKRPDTGDAYDPDTVSLKIKQPDGTETDVTPNHEGTGQYVYEMPAQKEGTWEYRFDGTGTLAAGGRKRFVVQSEF